MDTKQVITEAVENNEEAIETAAEAISKVELDRYVNTGRLIRLRNNTRIEKINRRYGENRQLLWSYKLTFSFTTDAGALEYLNGREFRTSTPDFVKKYFNGAKID